MYVNAASIGISPTQALSAGVCPAVEGDIARDIGGAFPINPGVRLQTQVAVRPQDIDIPTHDQAFIDGDVDAHVVGQRGQRAGEQEAKAALSGQVVGFL